MPQSHSNKKPIEHTPMSQFKSDGQQLLVNGNQLCDLKSRAGKTPFYAYDRSIIENNINHFKSSMPSRLGLHYAIKANPMPALVDFISPLVDGLDVASGLELNVALNSGKSANAISFAGPGKNLLELEMAVATGATINIESATELERINQLSETIGKPANIAVRVNPDFELKSSGMKMGGGSQQFGIDAEQVPEVLNTIKSSDHYYKGLHIFTGSQNLNSESIKVAHENIFALAARLQRDAKMPIQSLNIGGGLGIPYFPGEKPLQLNEIADALELHLDGFCQEFGDTHIAMELGRFIVGNAGIYVCEVTDIKESRDTRFAIVNGGLHHHLSASGNFGQVIRKNYPVAIGNKMAQPNTGPIQIVGPLCTPLDIMANKYNLPDVDIGDLVVIYQSGAYGFTASPRDFLSHPQPVEMLV